VQEIATCVIDEQLKVMIQQKLRNDLAKVC